MGRNTELAPGFGALASRAMAFTWRYATAADAPAIVELVNDAFEVEADVLTGERIGLPDVMQRLERGSFLVCEAEAGGPGARADERSEASSRREFGGEDGLGRNPGSARGFGALAGCVYVELRGTTGYLGLVSVASTRQSLGLGRDLMAAAEGWLQEAGCGVCQLWVLSSRPELLAWYGRRGYRVVRTEPFEAVNPPPTRKPLRPVHFEIMERDLTPLDAAKAR